MAEGLEKNKVEGEKKGWSEMNEQERTEHLRENLKKQRIIRIVCTCGHKGKCKVCQEAKRPLKLKPCRSLH